VQQTRWFQQDGSWSDSVCQKCILTSDKLQTTDECMTAPAKDEIIDCLPMPKNNRLINQLASR